MYQKKYEDQARQWGKLKSEGVPDKIIQEFVGISRVLYYRSKKILNDLENGMKPPSKKPRNVNKPRWGEAEKQLVLKIRRENPTYGKEKISIILKRDHAQTMSENTVGRILNYLKAKGLIQKSASALRTKRKRKFNKGHATP